MLKQEIIDFLKVLCPVWKVEFNNLDKIMTFDEALTFKWNIYFLASVKENTRRNSDKDIIFKNYFFVDFDIRENYFKDQKTIITDEELDIYLDNIKQTLTDNWFWDWKYIVNTWNWFHFYWVWVWNNYSVEDYKLAIENYFKQIDWMFTDWIIKTDHACKNIWRIARLPWTINYWRETKYKLEPKEATIIEQTDIVSEKIANIPDIARLEKQKEVQKDIQYRMRNIDDTCLQAILELDIVPLIEDYTWLQLGKDKKNFPDKNWNTGMFVADNILHWTGTSRISDKFNGYNTFLFVKQHYNLDNNWTFQRFKDRYSHIQELSNDKKKEYKQEIKKVEKQQELSKNIRVEKETIDWKFWWYRPSRWLDYLDKEFRKLDDAWELIVMFWPPWCWKTEIGFFIAKANKDIKSVYFCLEIPEDTILKRRWLRKNWLDWEDVDYNKIEEHKQVACVNTINYFKKESKKYLKMISISEQPSIEQLLLKMEQEKEDKTIFIIDNLWKITWDDNENIRFADITSKLQTFAYNNHCRVILQHHTIKPMSNNKQKDLDNVFSTPLFWPYGFRGSQKIYDNCTRLMEIHREYEAGKTQLLQYKHTPTDTRWLAEIAFEKWDFIEYIW